MDDQREFVTLVLTDRRPEVRAAWSERFGESAPVEIMDRDLFEADADAILLPGNSFGFLESGVELEATEVFGLELQDRLRERIRAEHDGELLVGQAIALPLAQREVTIVYAPLWRVPGRIERSVNVFLAVRGALLALRDSKLPHRASRLAVSGLGVDPGGMHPAVSARQVRAAYAFYVGKRGAGNKNLTQIRRRDKKMRTVPTPGSADSD